MSFLRAFSRFKNFETGPDITRLFLKRSRIPRCPEPKSIMRLQNREIFQTSRQGKNDKLPRGKRKLYFTVKLGVDATESFDIINQALLDSYFSFCNFVSLKSSRYYLITKRGISVKDWESMEFRHDYNNVLLERRKRKDKHVIDVLHLS